MSRITPLVLLIGITICMPSHAVEVRGRVDSQSSGLVVPRSNIPVRLIDCNNPDNTIQSTVTDPNGMYFFTQVPAGSYCISIPNFNVFPVEVPEQTGLDLPPIVMPN